MQRHGMRDAALVMRGRQRPKLRGQGNRRSTPAPTVPARRSRRRSSAAPGLSNGLRRSTRLHVAERMLRNRLVMIQSFLRLAGREIRIDALPAPRLHAGPELSQVARMRIVERRLLVDFGLVIVGYDRSQGVGAAGALRDVFFQQRLRLLARQIGCRWRTRPAASTPAVRSNRQEPGRMPEWARK